MRYEHIGEHIRFLRSQRHLTQSKLAELMNIDPYFLSKIENGTKHIPIDRIELAAAALNVTIDRLFGIEDVRMSLDTQIQHEILDLLQGCSPEEVSLILQLIVILKQLIASHL